jgi:hypothetical protein
MHAPHVHGHRFTQVECLRSPERVAHLEIERVADQVLTNVFAHTLLDVGTKDTIHHRPEIFHNPTIDANGVIT